MTLKGISTSDLQKELARREKGLSKLEDRRAKLLKELEGVEGEIAVLLGSKPKGGRGRGGKATGPRAGGRKRAKNKLSLPDAIAQAMEVRAIVSPKEAAELVIKNGYKTTSPNFNMMVSNALAKDSRFKRLGRGQYERIK